MYPFLEHLSPTLRHGDNNPLQPGKYIGTNWSVPTDTPILSVGPGKVIFADWSSKLDIPAFCYISSNAGIIVIIESLDYHGIYFVYAHLNRTHLELGAIVNDGESIGFSGSTGLTTGPTFSLVALQRGKSRIAKPVNPEDYLQWKNPAVKVGDSIKGTYKNGMPKEIIVGSTVVKVKRRKQSVDLELNESNAYYSINSELIVISKHLNGYQAKYVLLHEILHAIKCHQGGNKYIQEVMKAKKKVSVDDWEHYFIDMFDKALIQILRDNPNLVAYLIGP